MLTRDFGKENVEMAEQFANEDCPIVAITASSLPLTVLKLVAPLKA